MVERQIYYVQHPYELALSYPIDTFLQYYEGRSPFRGMQLGSDHPRVKEPMHNLQPPLAYEYRKLTFRNVAGPFSIRDFPMESHQSNGLNDRQERNSQTPTVGSEADSFNRCKSAHRKPGIDDH